jgi:hypothetical protein
LILPRHSAVSVVVGLTAALFQPALAQSLPNQDRPFAPRDQKNRTTYSPVAAETAVNVRHLESSGPDDWSVAETANFRIFHLRSRELADQAARLAEQTRTDMLRRWFGGPCKDWVEPCDLYLYPTGEDYHRCTGAPAYSSGHSSFSWTGNGVIHRRIDVHCDDPNLLTGVLPHETAHGVLAGRFGHRQVPRWADEGMAVLTEPRDKIRRHLRFLPDLRRDRQLFGVRELMELAEYPPPERIPAFYAQSISLVQFLSTEKGPQVFTSFVRDGMNAGYELALKQYYGWDLAELGRRWQCHAFRE